MNNDIKIIETDPNSSKALLLLEELSEALEAITGSSGKNSFHPEDVCIPRSSFVIAYDENGEALGCGGFRPINESTAEVKRMYARTKSIGVGTKILMYLEIQASKLDYTYLWVETRLINERAVAFYENRGYYRIPNYGKYNSNPEAVCFEKKIDG